MENHHFNREINYEWAMFNSYVKLPEGIESGVRPLCESINYFYGPFSSPQTLKLLSGSNDILYNRPVTGLI